MTYKDILTRVANNLGLPAITSPFISMAKKDIFDVLTRLTQEHEHVTNEIVIPITESAQEFSIVSKVPDFYSPLELVFLNSDGSRYFTKEVLPETLLKWNPDTEQITATFTEVMTDATPDVENFTTENELLDGNVCYAFTDDYPAKLSWKPAISGNIKMIYVRYPIMSTTGYGYNYGFNYATSDLTTAIPNLHPAYQLMIVEGVTIKMLVRDFRRKGMTEVEFLSIKEMLNEHKMEFKKQSDLFAAFVKKTATFEAKEIEFPDFLFDRAMLL